LAIVAHPDDMIRCVGGGPWTAQAERRHTLVTSGEAGIDGMDEARWVV
jgi:LmbE family N-acetylglucosaminyl deacetylase